VSVAIEADWPVCGACVAGGAITSGVVAAAGLLSAVGAAATGLLSVTGVAVVAGAGAAVGVDGEPITPTGLLNKSGCGLVPMTPTGLLNKSAAAKVSPAIAPVSPHKIARYNFFLFIDVLQKLKRSKPLLLPLY
jgi:hypothetical protein